MATAVAAPEMKGPVKGVLWVHNAILRETSTFGEAVAKLGSEGAADASPVLEQFNFFRTVLEFHEESEDRDVSRCWKSTTVT